MAREEATLLSACANCGRFIDSFYFQHLFSQLLIELVAFESWACLAVFICDHGFDIYLSCLQHSEITSGRLVFLSLFILSYYRAKFRGRLTVNGNFLGTLDTEAGQIFVVGDLVAIFLSKNFNMHCICINFVFRTCLIDSVRRFSQQFQINIFLHSSLSLT